MRGSSERCRMSKEREGVTILCRGWWYTCISESVIEFERGHDKREAEKTETGRRYEKTRRGRVYVVRRDTA